MTSLQMWDLANITFSRLSLALSVAVGLVACSLDDGSTWHQPQASRRAGFTVPGSIEEAIRLGLPAGAESDSVRVVRATDGVVILHWIQTLEVRDTNDVAASSDIHYGFPRMVRAQNGNLLVFYRVGTSHAYDYSQIAMRRSRDVGKTWSEERILHTDPKRDHSVHNPVAFVTKAGRVILWVSSYGFESEPKTRDPGYWSWSDDHGETWAPFVRFDHDPSRSVYYVTDVYQTWRCCTIQHWGELSRFPSPSFTAPRRTTSACRVRPSG